MYNLIENADKKWSQKVSCEKFEVKYDFTTIRYLK